MEGFRMPKFIIEWDCGYGPNYEVVEAETQDKADERAYEAWREDAESNANYKAHPWTQELAEQLSVDE